MRKLLLLSLLSCLCYNSFAQSVTAATYALSTRFAAYASVAGGTTVPAIAGDDVVQTNIAIGFTFRFCGTNYTTFAANSNGYLSLANSGTTGATSYTNSQASLTGIGAGRGMLMPFWDDVNGAAAGANSTSCSGVLARYSLTGSAPNRIFTFEWFNWGMYHATGASTPAGCGSFEVKLYETTNIVEFHYGSNSFSGATATIGIANSNADFFCVTSNIGFPPFSTATFNTAQTTTPATGIVYRFCPQNIRTAASNGGPYCSQTSAVLTGTVSGAATFTWAGPSAYSATGSTVTIPNVPVTAAGSYTLTGTIGTCTANDTTNMTVNPKPPKPTGSDSVCVASSIALTDATAGGTWTTSAAAIGSVSAGGVVTGVSAGNVTITYRIPATGCDTVKTIRVDALPAAPAAIGGATSTCQGSSTVLTDATAGGAWSSSNAGIASINAGGTVFGVTPGSVTITYTVTNSHGCQNFITKAFSVTLFSLGPITGSPTVCVGATDPLSNSTAGGTWSTSNASIASIDAGGVVTGVAVGSATITYNLTNSCGSIDSFFSITVNDVPTVAAITGTTTFCEGSTTTLADATSGGTWSTSDATVASVDPSGVVTPTGVGGGTVTISYAVTNACGTTTVTTLVTIDPLPVAGTITGTPTVCVGAVTTLSDASAGGTWSTGSAAIASVDGSGNVTGVSSGTTDITYTVTNGCGTAFTTLSVTVNPLSSAGTISGTSPLCQGTSATYTDAVSGGTWSTADASVASVDASGIVTGVGVGTTLISYSVTTTCGTAISTASVTVNPTPPSAGTISGASSVCPGSSTTLSSSVSGGSWSSSDVTIATVNGSGVVTGITSGSVTITYSVTTACGTGTVTTAFTVTGPASHGVISGISTLCVGNSLSLSESVGGGSWSSANVAVATISGSGVVTAVGAGTTRISYSFSNGCFTTVDTASITVLSASSAGVITGPSTVCAGSTVTLADGIPGGTWSSSNTTIASINSSLGIVLGNALGSVTMSYTVTDACGTTSSTFPMTVITTPFAGTISGTGAICIGRTTTLVDTTSGGTWSSSNPAVATVSSTGVVLGLTAGSAVISYTITNPCGTDAATFNISVSAYPNAGVIVGPGTLCVGSTTLYTDTAVGGTWSSSNTARATVDATGNVTGVSTGLVNIFYSVVNACGSTNVTVSINVVTTPGTGTISGVSPMCQGTSATFTDTASGGVWSSSSTAVATVSTSGLVTGVFGGTAIISYAVTNGCGTAYATFNLTITPLSDAGIIGGPSSLCIGAGATMTETVGGGVWSSSAPSVATIGTTGVLNALSGGTAIISYTTTNSCGPHSATFTLTVRFPTNAGTITGSPTVCNGLTTTLTDTTSGGTWSTSSSSVASVNGSGVVTGVSIGSATITYTVTDACGTAATNFPITVVNPLSPATISGTTSICVGISTTLTPSVAGGTWNSGDTTVATVSSTGLVLGVAGGTAIISYTTTNACGAAVATAFMTINPYPAVGTISAPATICVGVPATLVDTPVGGRWSSSDPTVATIDTSSGIVTPLSTGSATITYSVTNGCGVTNVTLGITVGDVPSGAGTISGPSAVCPGATISLSESLSGGAWSTSDASIASVNGSGTVTGMAAGSANISYTMTNSCGSTSTSVPITVNVSSASGTISAAATTICVGSTDTLTDAVTGGTWSSSSTSVATVDASGIVTGMSAGAVTISYTVSNSCGTSSSTIGLNILPTPGLSAISGPASMCEGVTYTFSDTDFGGRWSSSDVSVASIDTTTGSALAIAAGTTIITYEATNVFGCHSMVTLGETVNPAPHAGSITASGTTFCAGTTLALTDTFAGGTGTWSSSNAAVATVDASGLVTGVAAGTADITYAVTNSCGTDYAVANLTVNPQPVLGPIIGPTTFCSGVPITMANATFGGTWASGDVTMASIDPTSGVVVGLAGGTVILSYTASNVFGCSTTVTSLDTIHLSADPGMLVVSTTTLCAGTSVAFSDTTSGGTWTSSDTTVAVADASGLVTALAAGSATISYTVPGAFGCDGTASATINIDPSPVVSPISGPTSMCWGGTLTLVDTTTGGTWSSSDVSVASIDASGVVYTSSSAGTAILSYTLTNGYGCSTSATQLDTISYAPLVTAIGGTTTICVGASTTLTDGYSGGVWASSDPAVASIDPATGVMTGVSAGTATISYTITASSACFTMVATTVTVDAIPTVSVITGTMDACPGMTNTLTDATAGGVWSSSDVAVATVSTTGDVTGVMGGTADISYTVTNASGCSASAIATFTVYPAPVVGAISGSGNACLGQVVTLIDTPSGGIWSSSNTAVVSIDPATGDMVGVSLSTATISYTVTNSFGCQTTATQTVTVNALPTVAAVTGTTTVCELATITLADATTGGVWSSANTAIATVDASGNVTGTGGGAVIISYRVTNAAGCYAVATATITVNPAPGLRPIVGPSAMCSGTAITFTEDSTGGTWSTSSASIVSVNVSGLVTAVAAGTATISYSKTSGLGCTRVVTLTVTVTAAPVVAAITGPSSVCEGSTITLADATAGGAWSSSNTAIATVGASGIVTGVSGGSVNIAYTVSSGGCVTAVITGITVNPLPIATLSGSSVVCTGTATSLSASIAGGTWSSSNTAVATVSASGNVTGIATGTATISYSVTSAAGCVGVATMTMTVNPAPAGTLVPSGSVTLCHGAPVNLTVAGAASGSVFQWYNTGSPIAGATNSSHIADTIGSYTVTVSTGGCVLTLGAVTVLPEPNPVILHGSGSTIYTGSFATYQWYLNGFAISGATNSIYPATAVGSYVVVVTDGNGCSDTSAAFAVTNNPGTGVHSIHATDIRLFPNPSSSVINVEAPISVTVSVVSPDGKVITRVKDAKAIDVSQLANGIYMIMVYDDANGLLKVERFVKVE